jgi:hypothetical protein
MVTKGTAIPIVSLLSYARDAGFSGLEITPGGGFRAGVKVGRGSAVVAILTMCGREKWVQEGKNLLNPQRDAQ